VAGVSTPDGPASGGGGNWNRFDSASWGASNGRVLMVSRLDRRSGGGVGEWLEM
jgi:hypothetical protein